MRTGVISPEVRRQEREAGIEIKKTWIYVSTPPYVLISEAQGQLYLYQDWEKQQQLPLADLKDFSPAIF
jgi:hypothetical protein